MRDTPAWEVRFVLVFGLFDLPLAATVLVFLVGSIVFISLPIRVARVGRTARVWLLVASLIGTGLFILFNVAYFSGDPVIGSPTRAQVTGTWVGSGGARLTLRPDGTFTASSLPAYVGQPTDFPDMLAGQTPTSGHGMWVIGQGASSVTFTFTCDPSGPVECTPSNLTFDLQAERHSPPGGAALFYYLGDPDNWSDQYAFMRR